MQMGIMQGRLVPPTAGRFQSFPRDRWADELPLAAEAGLNAIEWIYDEFGADVNPLADDAGLARLQKLCADNGLRVLSMCADYFMDRPLVRASESELHDRLATLTWLLGRAQQAGIRHVVLPFVDISRIDSEDDFRQVVGALRRVLPAAEATQVELHLETSLPPTRFAALLAELPHPLLKVNYDSGNSASLGYVVDEEFAAYGERIGSVHIKDRVRGGGTVPLGQGNADFEALFAALHDLDYANNFVLQVARGLPGEEVAWARQNASFVVAHWQPKS
jgi:L-ribulose-5-phosphate 3-epimerase